MPYVALFAITQSMPAAMSAVDLDAHERCRGGHAAMEEIGATVALTGDRRGNVTSVAMIVERRRRDAAADAVGKAEHLALVKIGVTCVDAGVNHSSYEVVPGIGGGVAVTVAVHAGCAPRARDPEGFLRGVVRDREHSVRLHVNNAR
jgi:Ni,Fe-hydrogenase III small subunit